MEDRKQKRKRVVKVVAVIFFAVILVLTFFSNTIMNYSLPRVATKDVTSGTVSSKVRGTGMVEAGKETTITSKESKTVNAVNVKTGDSVKAGDVLLTFQDEESEEIKNARQEVETAKSAYNKQLLVDEVSDDIKRQAEHGGVDYNKSRVELANLSAKVNETKAILEQKQQELKDYKPSNTTTVDEFGEEMPVEDKKAQELQTAVDNAQKSYEDAVAAHDKYVADINLVDEVKSAYEAIGTAQATLDRMEREAMGNEVKAEFDGTVQTISVESGSKVAPGDELVTLMNDADGYTLSISVTLKESKKVSIGDVGEIANAWSYGDVEAKVVSMKNDPSNPGKQRLIVFEIKGDISAGDSMTVSVGSKSQSYDNIVPNSAIREDSKGTFILVVRSKSSPLGNRYFARKIPVEVVQSDDINSAITGAVEYGDYVITSSNKMIKANDMVRLAD